MAEPGCEEDYLAFSSATAMHKGAVFKSQKKGQRRYTAIILLYVHCNMFCSNCNKCGPFPLKPPRFSFGCTFILPKVEGEDYLNQFSIPINLLNLHLVVA